MFYSLLLQCKFRTMKVCILHLILTTSLLHQYNCQGFRLAQSDDCGKTEEDPRDVRTKVPWVAGIFARSSSKQDYRFLITGTIISSRLVLSVISGVYGEPSPSNSVKKYFISPAANHLVAVGLKSNNLRNADSYTQIVQVSQVIPYGGHTAENRHYHIILFLLKTPLTFTTPYVRTACIPVFLKILPSTNYGSGVEVRQGGFSESHTATVSRAGELKITNVTIEPRSNCQMRFKEFYKGSFESQIDCGISVNKIGPAICTLHGSAPMAPVYNNRWFILGVTALIPPVKGERGWCHQRTIYFYHPSLQGSEMEWILDSIKCAEHGQYTCGGGECIEMAKVCNQKIDCKSTGADEDPIYCRAIKPCIYAGKNFECGVYGPCISESLACNGVKNCPNGEDEKNEICIGHTTTETIASITIDRIDRKPVVMLKTCPLPQIAEGVKVTCTNPSRGETIPCNNASVQTMAKFACQRYYKSNSRQFTTQMTCQPDGSWKPYRPFALQFICEPDCGILSAGFTAFIISGQETTRRDAFPWHASLYVIRGGEKVFICGGSLIEKLVVVTAAHCVTDVTGDLGSKSSFRVILGARYSEYEKNIGTESAQFFNIKNTWVPATYDRRSLQSDIAIVQLDHPAIFGEYVRPVCYLSPNSPPLPPTGELGKVAGFGYVNDTRIAEKLRFAAFPIIAPQECVESLKRIPPLSTFCAGYKNGTSVCQGDSGSGMAFPEQIGYGVRYIIKGIVSHGEIKEGKLCDPNNYAVFTHIDAFADWMLQRLEGILR